MSNAKGNSAGTRMTNIELAGAITNDAKIIAAKIPTPLEYLTFRQYKEHGGKFNTAHLAIIGSWKTVVQSPLQAVQLNAIRNEQRLITNTLGSQDLFLSGLKEVMAEFPAIKMKPYSSRRGQKSTKRAINLVISDLHIGADLDPEETGHKYGISEEARVVAHIARTVIEYKTKYRDETELHIHMYGDIIQNILHGISNADLLHLQTCRAMWLLSQMITRFAENFKTVHVHCAVGNHGRDTAIHHSRAIALKYNALETTIYYGIYLAVRNMPNVKWHQPKTPWVHSEILGHPMYGTHSDTCFSMPNPGSSINTKAIENKINKINASLKDAKEYKVVIVGHSHVGIVTKLSNGVALIVNGPGIPPDEYANSLDILESPQTQVMFETSEKYALGDSRFIDMAGTASDRSLDSIIMPWPGLVND